MSRRDAIEPVASRIASFLRLRGEPASSLMLAERFLQTAVPSETLATRLLVPLLEPEGMAYRQGAGWIAAAAAPVAPAGERLVTAIVDPGTQRVALVEAGGGVVPPGELDRAVVVMRDPRVEGPMLVHWLGTRGFPRPERIVSLSAVVRRAIRVPRGAGLADLCARLGVRWLEGERIEDVARAMAACVARALESAPAPDDDGDVALVDLPAGITAEDLACLPASPGVYRFYDAAGELLYVGKAKNLRRRVGSYFRRSRTTGHGSRFLHRVHRLEHDVAGSELEALLKEARQIGRLAPAGNVQNEVRERGRRYDPARTMALLLPRDGGGTVVILVEAGGYGGHATLGPRGGGRLATRRLLARVIGGARRRRGRGTDRDTEVLNSWLARNAGTVSRLELDGYGSVDEALAALTTAAEALSRDPAAAVFRRSP